MSGETEGKWGNGEIGAGDGGGTIPAGRPIGKPAQNGQASCEHAIEIGDESTIRDVIRERQMQPTRSFRLWYRCFI